MPPHITLASALGQHQPRHMSTGISSIDDALRGTFSHIVGIGTAPGLAPLALEILATQLLRSAQSQPRTGPETPRADAAYLVTSAALAPSSVSTLHRLVRERILVARRVSAAGGVLAPVDVKDVLARVRILRYLDLVGLVESIDEVVESGSELVLVQGLEGLVGSMRASGGGIAKVCAGVGSVFAGLRAVVSGSSVVVVEVSAGVGVAGRGVDVESAWRGGMSVKVCVEPGMLGPVVECVVDEMDIVVIVHDAGGSRKTVVEVVRDERIVERCAVGQWAIWEK